MIELPLMNRSYTQNRELSWLKFNKRVLEEAADDNVPLLERLKYISIFSNNLDEFFMIRVGSLFELYISGEEYFDNKTGMTAEEQLEKIYLEIRSLYEQKTKVYQEIKAELMNYGICSLDFSELEPNEVKYVKEYFKVNIKQILSPQIVDTHHPFPHIENKEIYIVSRLKYSHNYILGLLPIPQTLPELVFLPGSDTRFIRIEKILFEFANIVFGDYKIVEKNCLCITRNADINPNNETQEIVEDFRSQMKKLLHKRKRLSVVRLEANYPISETFQHCLCERFGIIQEQIYISSTPLKTEFVYGLFSKLSASQAKQLIYPSFSATETASIDSSQSILKQIKQKDILLYYPYENMSTFLQMIKEAANNPNVISIKIAIYRLAKKAKLVDYLCAAAENGKDVTVLMELRARFDEQNNINWSEKLEDSGCRIIYGFKNYKVHAKLCLITMKDKNGISFITQVGTGNYNETTAEVYTDLSLITASPEIGQDAVEYFKNMSIGNMHGNYKHLLVAPIDYKTSILKLIDEEIAKGSRGAIMIKVNSLTDLNIIEKLADASKAGVNIKLIIRGICCLVPQVHGETDNISVISIVGRYLEHSRIYCFGTGDEQKIYIASADLMTRNTERRIEVACPVIDSNIKDQINQILEVLWNDTVKARVLNHEGDYEKKAFTGVALDSQMQFMQKYYDRSKKTEFKITYKERILSYLLNKIHSLIEN